MLGISKYMMAGMGALLLVSGLANWWFFEKNGSLRETIVIEKANVQIVTNALDKANGTINKITEHQEQQQAQLDTVYADYEIIEMERNDAIQTLNNYRGRFQNVALARPTWLGRMATRKSNVMFCNVFIATGGKPREGDDCFSPPKAKTDTPD